MTSVPQPASNSLILELNELLAHGRPSAFALKRLEKQAKELLRVDAAAAYNVLGALASTRGDVAAMRASHGCATRLDRTSIPYWMNYALSLSRTGFFNEAALTAARAHELDTTDLAVVGSYIGHLCLAGLFNSAASARERFVQLAPDKPVPQGDILALALTRLSDANVDEAATSLLVLLSEQVLHEHAIYRPDPVGRVISDEFSKSVLYTIAVDISPKKVLQLNIDLADRIARSDRASAASSVLCTEFSAVESINVNSAKGLA